MINFEDRSREKAYSNLRKVMKHWGFGEASSSIYALLSVSDRPLTAREIAEHVGYAYSSVVNELNRLLREGFLERWREGRRYVYSAETDFLKIIKNERNRLIGMLEEAKSYLQEVKTREMHELVENIEIALRYLREVNRRFEDGREAIQ